ncbi:MAG TPA: M20/M25/M40 family metallo-hydrolase [Gemmatimonadaceae bacterium]|nr:M20/M25/M40 family metallo-hydrolase [Gemmatimonadaceae bacterium]
MRRTIAAVLLAAFAPIAGAQAISRSTETAATRLIAAALADTMAYHRLAEMTDTYGNRLSGSANLERAIDWVLTAMKADGFANVRGEPVLVPHWVRGEESAVLNTPRRTALHMLGLGGSVGTPATGITAPVLVVKSFDDLAAHASQVKGKIVVYDSPFPMDSAPMAGYGAAVAYRSGASQAAKLGAVAALTRSIASFSIRSPHTGATRYDTTVAKIPMAAISVEDAEMLHRMQDRGQHPEITLKMSARTEPDAPSRNVVAEIVGSEHPEEVIVMGGHIDSWDVGQGAMDDGGGCLAAWEALRLIKSLGLVPKRTIRVVLWTNEENGGRGGRGYHDAHLAELGKHVAAIESDGGVFSPVGFNFQGSDAGLAVAKQIGALLAPVKATKMVKTADGDADVTPLIREGVPGFGLDVDDTKYFWFHHSEGDMMTMIDRNELRRCIAAMAVLAYSLADLPSPLPRK